MKFPETKNGRKIVLRPFLWNEISGKILFAKSYHFYNEQKTLSVERTKTVAGNCS